MPSVERLHEVGNHRSNKTSQIVIQCLFLELGMMTILRPPQLMEYLGLGMRMQRPPPIQRRTVAAP
jgi:hypothetical protein